jgi:hypothetical protein
LVEQAVAVAQELAEQQILALAVGAAILRLLLAVLVVRVVQV